MDGGDGRTTWRTYFMPLNGAARTLRGTKMVNAVIWVLYTNKGKEEAPSCSEGGVMRILSLTDLKKKGQFLRQVIKGYFWTNRHI